MRDLKRDKEICDKATKGKWRVEKTYHEESGYEEFIKKIEIICRNGVITAMSWSNPAEADAQFIASAREGWPYAIDRAIAAEAEVERLRGQVEKMKNCGNCKWFQDKGECVNPKNTEQDCEYYRGNFWEEDE